MAVTNSKVLFCYVPHNKTMPATPDANTVYFLEDAQELWVGNKLIASNAMTEPPTFDIVGSGDYIADAEYDSETNTLTLTKSTLPVYTITKQQQAESGYSATYQLFVDGTATGDKINIPLDMVIENAEYKVVTTADVPYQGAQVGDPYLDFTVANAAQSHLYVPLKDLVDVYTGGTHITVTNNVINHDSQGSDASTPMGQDIPSPGQGQTGTINVSGQVAYDSLGHVISVTVKNIYSSVKTVADASAAAVGADKVDKINSPTGDMIAKSTSTGNVAETSISVSDLTGALSDISDLQSDKMDKIANASGDKILVSNSSGEAVEGYGIAENDSGIMGIPLGYFTGASYGDILIFSDLGEQSSLLNSDLNISDLATTTDLADKIDKIASATGGKIATTTATGEVAESNTSISDLTTAIGGKVTKIANATGGKIATTTASGEVAESGTAIADLAQIGASGFTTGYIVTADSNGKLQATTDPSHFINYIAGATGGKIVTSTNDGQVAESNTAISDLATQTDLADKIDKPESFQGDYFLMSHDDGEGNFEIVEGFPLAANKSEGLLTGYFDNPQPNEILTFNQFGTTGGIVQSSGVNVNDIMTKIDSASGDKVLVSNSNGEAVESDIGVSNLITGSLTSGYYLVLSSDNHEVTTEGSVTLNDIATLDYIGTIPQGSSATDVIGYIDEVAGDKVDRISNATGGKITESTAAGGIVETAYSVSDLRTSISAAQTDVDALETLVGTIPAGSSATTVVDYAQEVADAAAGDAVGDLDLAQVGGAGYYLTAVSQTDGQVAASATLADTTVTNASSNLVTSGAVYTAVANATPTWTVVE